MKVAAASLCLAIVGTAIVSLAEDTELRDLDVTGWECANKFEGSAQSREARERNCMKNRWPVNLSAFTVESVDTAGFLKKVREYDSRLQSRHRSQLTNAQKDRLDSYENQIVSLTGWLVLAYAGPGETTNCGDAIFHDWHLEISEKPSDHGPQVGDATPII